MDEAVRKYGKWIVAAIFGIIALYFSTQVFLLASLPTDPRRAPDLPPEVETASFVVLPGDERVLESRQALAKAAEKICDADRIAGVINHRARCEHFTVGPWHQF